MPLPIILPTRTSGDANSASDINALMTDIEYLEEGKLDIEKNEQTITGDIIIDGDLTVTGKTLPKSGEILEYLTSPCDGSSVVGTSGTYTWPNVAGVCELTVNYADVTGSILTYTPPAGTKKVVYKFQFTQGGVDTIPYVCYRFYIDADEVVYARRGYQPESDFNIVWEWVINIGGVANTNVGRVASWFAPKTVKLTARDYGTSNEGKIHTTRYWDGGESAQFSMPILTIIAIA